MSDRPNIPEELKRRVLVESGHRCAIPTCRQIVVEVHHIVPWESCQKHEYENLIALCPNCHTMAHNRQIDRKALYLYKANLRFTHDRFSQLEVDLLFECAKNPDKSFMWSACVLLLIKRMIDANYLRVERPRNAIFADGMMMSPLSIQITPQGLDYVHSLGEVQL